MSTIGPLFDEYRRVSGLGLNVQKTVLVPLFKFEVTALRSSIVQSAPVLCGIGIDTSAKYLGVVVGPGKGDKSWTAPLRKYAERLQWWRDAGAGMLITLQAYRCYIASVLVFVAQLEELPSNFAATEDKAVRKLFPGPRDWITAAAMKDLKVAGFPMELPDTLQYGVAARARVARHEDRCNGGLQVRERRRKLLTRLGAANDLDAEYHAWIQKGFLCALHDATVVLLNAERKLGTENSLLGFGNGSIQQKEGWQKRAYALLRSATPSGALRRHLRRRLDRWKIPVLPGHRVERAVATLKCISSRAPPRVWAVVLKTFCNGWVTARRFQSAGTCPFCGRADSDSLENFARCHTVAQLFEKHAGIGASSQADGLLNFLCLSHGHSNLCPQLRGGDERATAYTLRGVALHALHKVANHRRHGQLSLSEVEHAFKPLLDAAAQGCPQAASLLQRARRRARPA